MTAPPPDACWLCTHTLGSDAQCVMCDAYRKDTAPTHFRNGHESLCEAVLGGDSPWCSCGYERWRDEQSAVQSPQPLTEST